MQVAAVYIDQFPEGDLGRQRIARHRLRQFPSIAEALTLGSSKLAVDGVAIIAESHVAVHTWPEHGYAAVDIFTCNLDVDIQVGIDALTKHFLPGRTQVMEVRRGMLS